LSTNENEVEIHAKTNKIMLHPGFFNGSEAIFLTITPAEYQMPVAEAIGNSKKLANKYDFVLRFLKQIAQAILTTM
jgi:hypothetical protein